MSTRGVHVIWTTYMTWPPGDRRGHWSGLLDMYGRLQTKGHQLNLPDAETETYAKQVAVDSPKILKPAERVVVAHELSRHVRWPTHTPLHAHSPRFTGGDGEMSIQYPTNTNQRNDAPGKPGAMCDKPICYAAAIEDNHVHLLFGSITEDIGKFVGRLKGRTSSILKKLPANRDRQRIWTAGYWKVFLFDEPAVAAVARYIQAHNVRKGLNASPYDWLTPLNT